MDGRSKLAEKQLLEMDAADPATMRSESGFV